MKHFTSEEWLDFARRAAPSELNESMQRHLDDGCKACRQILRIWQRIADVAHREARYVPPPGAVRIAKAAFAAQAAPGAGSSLGRVAKLVFDSFRQGQLAGVRSAEPAPRQLLYSYGPLMVDVRVDPQSVQDKIAVTGQVLDSSTPETTLTGVMVRVIDPGGVVTHTKTNQFGEFHIEVDRKPKLHLQIDLGERFRLAVPMGWLLDPTMASDQEGKDETRGDGTRHFR